MFDVQQFLDDNRIYYRDSGPNCGKNGVAIKCPFCGDEDPSEHLAWNIQNGKWYCWRRGRTHAGNTPHRLVRKLLSCSPEEADSIVNQRRTLDPFKDVIRRLKEEDTDQEEDTRTLEFPPDFKRLTFKGSGLHYARYLVNRGFRKKDIPKIVKTYDLRYCTSGPFRGRIIFPVYVDGKLVCWTGRTISTINSIRYLTLSSDLKGLTPYYVSNFSPLLSLKSTLGYFDLIKAGGAALVITEGPLDALKMDVYGRKLSVRGTCLFGSGITDDQLYMLADIRSRFDKLVILGDAGAQRNVWALQDNLSVLKPQVVDLLRGTPDPGALSPKGVRAQARRILQ